MKAGSKKITNLSKTQLTVFMANINKKHLLLAKLNKDLAYVIDSIGNREKILHNRIRDLENAERGLTLRQWFAGPALICAALSCIKPEARIEWSFQIADSMIAFERGNPGGQKHATENQSNVVGAPGEGDSALAEAASGSES
jgi:hypothetical protein